MAKCYFFAKLGAGGFPDVQEGHVNVQLRSGTINQGVLEEICNSILPNWMKSRPQADMSYKAFIRIASKRHFESRIDNVISIATHNNPNNMTDIPKYAKLHLENEHLLARSFHLYQRPFFKPRNFLHNFPSKNSIYIMVPGGRIYSSKLENYQAIITLDN